MAAIANRLGCSRNLLSMYERRANGEQGVPTLVHPVLPARLEEEGVR